MKSRYSSSIALCVACFLSAEFWNPSAARAVDTFLPFDGERTTWHEGFDRYDYLMDEASFAVTPFKRPDSEKFAVGNPPKGQRRCIVVVPKRPASGHPWSWQACYWASAGLQPGAFNLQGMLAVPAAKFLRQLGSLDTDQMRQIETAVRRWLGL